MRQVHFDRPFTGGVVKDQPAYKLGPNNSRSAQDLIYPQGIATNRRGWEYSGDTQIAAKEMGSVHRARYVLNDNTREVVCAIDGDIYVNAASGAATRIFDGSVEYIPRCVYRDELILCARDGVSPVLRFSGAVMSSRITYNSAPAAFLLAAYESRFTDATNLFSSLPSKGSFLTAQWTEGNANVYIWVRVVEAATSGVPDFATLEDYMATSALSSLGDVTAGEETGFTAYGYAFPCVEIYNAGTASFTFADFDLTGFGTKWSTGDLTLMEGNRGDGVVLIPDGASSQFFGVRDVEDDDTIACGGGGNGTNVTKSQYRIQRRMPFGDAASHKGSLFGSVCSFYPNRVWAGPPGWNISFPPGDLLPFDPSADYVRENADDWKMDHIDIPAAYDGDQIVAILSSPDPLVVCKRKDAWGLYGEFPNFERVRLPGGYGAGCIDMRSAHNLSVGAVWAGENGIYIFDGTQVRDITSGRINDYWKSLTADFSFGSSDYCTIGEKDGHVIISIATNSGNTKVRLVYDARTDTWPSDQFTNHDARYFFSSRVENEAEKLLWVGPSEQGRVMNSANVFTSGGGNVDDDDGTSPTLDAYTTEGLDGDEALDRDSRVMDVAVSANIYDVGVAGSTSVEVSLISAGSYTAPAAVTTVLGEIDSDTVDRPDRSYFHPVNQDGRTHQIRVRSTAVGTDNTTTKQEIPEITLTVDDMRSRT